MHFITEEHFDTALQHPGAAADLIKMLSADLAVAMAILGGPDATPETFGRMVGRIMQDLADGSALAHIRLKAHLDGQPNQFTPVQH